MFPSCLNFQKSQHSHFSPNNDLHVMFVVQFSFAAARSLLFAHYKNHYTFFYFNLQTLFLQLCTLASALQLIVPSIFFFIEALKYVLQRKLKVFWYQFDAVVPQSCSDSRASLLQQGSLQICMHNK